MKTTKQLGIWMDHASAHVIVNNDENKSTTIVSEFTHEEKQESLQNGETTMHNTRQQLQAEYYEKIAEAILPYNDVLLFGPTNAKVELYNILKKDNRFSDITIEAVTADKMTENQEHAFVKNYFSKK